MVAIFSEYDTPVAFKKEHPDYIEIIRMCGVDDYLYHIFFVSDEGQIVDLSSYSSADRGQYYRIFTTTLPELEEFIQNTKKNKYANYSFTWTYNNEYEIL
jgi:hypothetical protein